MMVLHILKWDELKVTKPYNWQLPANELITLSPSLKQCYTKLLEVFVALSVVEKLMKYSKRQR